MMPGPEWDGGAGLSSGKSPHPQKKPEETCYELGEGGGGKQALSWEGGLSRSFSPSPHRAPLLLPWEPLPHARAPSLLPDPQPGALEVI